MMIVEDSTQDMTDIAQLFPRLEEEATTDRGCRFSRIEERRDEDASLVFADLIPWKNPSVQSTLACKIWSADGVYISARIDRHRPTCRRLPEAVSTDKDIRALVARAYEESNRYAIEHIGRIRECAPSSTSESSEADVSAVVKQEIQSIFRMAQKVLESEAEQILLQHLPAFVRKYENLAVIEIRDAVLTEQITTDSAEAALRILGDIDHQSTYADRRRLLEDALTKCSSPVVRDGANVGLSYMDDPHAISFLEKAVEREENPLARKLMKKTLVQLEETVQCRSSCV